MRTKTAWTLIYQWQQFCLKVTWTSWVWFFAKIHPLQKCPDLCSQNVILLLAIPIPTGTCHLLQRSCTGSGTSSQSLREVAHCTGKRRRMKFIVRSDTLECLTTYTDKLWYKAATTTSTLIIIVKIINYIRVQFSSAWISNCAWGWKRNTL